MSEDESLDDLDMAEFEKKVRDDFTRKMGESVEPDWDSLSDVDVGVPETSTAEAWYQLVDPDRRDLRGPTHSFDVSGKDTLSELERRYDIEYETYEIGATPEMTKKVIERIADEIQQREREGYEIEQLVLGQPQYEVVEAYAQDHYGGRAEDALPIDDIIVVPGPMICPVIDNRRMLMEYKAEKEE